MSRGVENSRRTASPERQRRPQPAGFNSMIAALLGIYALTVLIALLAAFVGAGNEIRPVLLVIFPAQTALLATLGSLLR